MLHLHILNVHKHSNILYRGNFNCILFPSNVACLPKKREKMFIFFIKCEYFFKYDRNFTFQIFEKTLEEETPTFYRLSGLFIFIYLYFDVFLNDFPFQLADTYKVTLIDLDYKT